MFEKQEDHELDSDKTIIESDLQNQIHRSETNMKGKTILKWISNCLSTLFIILLVCAVLIVISSRAAGGE
ncbi:hypothetical protein MUB24_15255, partial [Lederbergia sp. NSJ-179]|nr:hypothetical protein [Lederbergia sp. NSJ-179]